MAIKVGINGFGRIGRIVSTIEGDGNMTQQKQMTSVVDPPEPN